MKLTLSQIRDIEEDPDPYDDDSQEEAYHQEMMSNKRPHNDYSSFLHDAEKSIGSAQPLSWVEFVKKWG